MGYQKSVASLLLASALTASFSAKGGAYNTKLQICKTNLSLSLTDSAFSVAFYNTMVDSIFPDWMGTKWDFNGISNTPKKGEIACGYFVSTTLKHIGFNLNRYHLAQQAASVIINAICKPTFTYTNQNELFNTLLKAGNNKLYVLGLDYHVGFLAVENGIVYFIHSDYVNGKVVRERANQSTAFHSTQAYVVGELTNNSDLFKQWRSNENIFSL